MVYIKCKKQIISMKNNGYTEENNDYKLLIKKCENVEPLFHNDEKCKCYFNDPNFTNTLGSE
jgi:hypothetical protein